MKEEQETKEGERWKGRKMVGTEGRKARKKEREAFCAYYGGAAYQNLMGGIPRSGLYFCALCADFTTNLSPNVQLLQAVNSAASHFSNIKGCVPCGISHTLVQVVTCNIC